MIRMMLDVCTTSKGSVGIEAMNQELKGEEQEEEDVDDDRLQGVEEDYKNQRREGRTNGTQGKAGKGEKKRKGVF